MGRPFFLLSVALLVSVAVGATTWWATSVRGGSDLAQVHDGIVADFSGVSHMSADELQAMPPDDVVVFDVREPSEYAVSHLKGSTRVDPRISADAFFKKYGDKIAGKSVVFYCAVGRRSSALADRVQSRIPDHGGKGTFNLTGGLFQWRNEGRPLVAPGQSSTDAVHPFNDYWGRLVQDQGAVSYTPVR